jgi:hypothetical protein
MPEGGCVLFAVASFVSFFSLFSLLPFDVLGLAGLRLEVAGALSQSSPRIGFRTDFPFENTPNYRKTPVALFPAFHERFCSFCPDVSGGF